MGGKTRRRRSLPNDIIVVFAASALNAHFCDCLAHFSIRLEKCINHGHNDCVGKDIWSVG